MYKFHQFVDEVTVEGLALPTSFVNPGITTARALLLTMALYPEMERLGQYPMRDHDTWEQSRRWMEKTFKEVYAFIERGVETPPGTRCR